MAYIKGNKSSLKKKTFDKIIYKMQPTIIINLMQYIYSDSDYITDRSYNNLKRLIDLIDEERSYTEEDGNALEYFRILKGMLEILIKTEMVYNKDDFKIMIREKFTENQVSDNTIETVFDSELLLNGISDKQVLYWNKFIQDKLDYYSIFKQLDSLQTVIDNFRIPNTNTDANNIIPEAKEIIQSLYKELQVNKSSEQSKINIFNPMGDISNAKTVIRNSLDSFLNSGAKLSTGIQGLDKMINGGLQNGRCYLFVGIPKHFKSGTMLNICLNIACNCKNWVCKNKNTIPTVLYYTMENSLNETLERVYNYLGMPFDFEYELIKNKNGYETKKYKLTDEEINSVIKTIQKETYERTGICFMIEYNNKRNTDTGVFYQIYDDLLAQGFEMIFLAQDYIKKIRSVQPALDVRQELGNVVDEFCTFAKDKEIPVLTIHQFNREAMKMLENNTHKDVGRKLNASMVGDSNLVLENADVSIAVDKEFDEDTQKNFATFNIMLSRIKIDPSFTYIAQPFDPDPKYKGFRIAVDTDKNKPLYVDRISKTLDNVDRSALDSSNESIKKRLGKKNTSIIKMKNMEEEIEEAELDDETLKRINEFSEEEDDDIE